MANQFSAAITAEVNRGKASGFYIEKSKFGGDQDDPLTALIKRMQGSALPVVSDADIPCSQIPPEPLCRYQITN